MPRPYIRLPVLAALAVAVSALPAEGAALRHGAGAVTIDPKGAPPVMLAEVASQIEPGASRLSNLTEVLRSDVEAELAAIDWNKESVRRRYKLSAALVRLETARTEGMLRVSCTVSAAVRDERGVLLATVEGRARSEGAGATGGSAASAEQGAIAGAVRGAITAVPEAIRRLR
jgi:hypothetical protein